MTINIQQKNKRVIRLPYGVRKEIAETFEVTVATVWNALTYKTTSKKARAIRAYAIEKLKEINN